MTETCVCCGEEIHEGRMVCWRCENGVAKPKPIELRPETLRGMLNIMANDKGIRLTGQRHR